MDTMLENADLSRQASAMAASACIDLFAAYNVHLDPTADEIGGDDTPMICGMLGFVGSRVRGTCMLAAHTDPVARTCPAGGRVRDWIAELTNQLGGRLKSEFLGRNLELSLSTPMALTGVRVQPLPRGMGKPIALDTHDGTVLVWVEVECAPEFTLGQPGDGQVCRSGGAVLLF
jgi:hypothetical protein